jgi:periplasmic divalent cation tolerance protein
VPPSPPPADSGRPRASASDAGSGSDLPDPGAFVVALVTVPDVATAEKIADALLAERLAACVNRVGPLHSRFRWKGALDAADEQLLLIKARRSALTRIEARIRGLHPYEVFELLALPVAAGSAPYLSWLAAETDA